MNPSAPNRKGSGLAFLAYTKTFLTTVAFIVCATASINTSEAQNLQITDFVLFAGDGTNPAGTAVPPAPGYGVSIGTSNTINGGNIGARVLVKSSGNITGDVRSGQRVEFANSIIMNGSIYAANGNASTGSTVLAGSSLALTGSILANGNISVGGGSISGSVTKPSNYTYSGPTPNGGIINAVPVIPALPSLPTPTVIPAAGTQNITANTTITPGAYGNVTLGGNRTVTLAGPGDYIFNSINNSGTNNNFRFDFQNNSNGVFRIFVKGNAILNKSTSTIINGGSANRIYMEVQGNGAGSTSNAYAFVIANGASGGVSRWFGTIYAPYAGILMGSGTGSTSITGSLWSGTQVIINSGVTTNYAAYVNCQTPVANAGADQSINCTNATATLNGSASVAGATFSWVASNGGNIVSGANTATPVVNAAGTYTLTVSTGSVCTATDVAVVTANLTPPNANAGIDQTLTCATTSVVLNGSSTTAGATFNWSGPGIVSGGNTATPTVNAAGSYTVVVTNPANGCTASDVVVVGTNLTTPNADAGPDGEITCAQTVISLNGSSSTAGVTYSWSGPGILSGANSASATVNVSGTYTLTVTSNTNGCTSTDDVSVGLNIKVPIANAGTDAELTCSTTSITLAGSSSVSPSNFSWNGPGIVSGGNTATPTVNAAGTYTVTVTDPSNGCTATDDVEILLNNTAPNADAGADNTIDCSNAVVGLTASSTTAAATFVWSGPGISGASNTSSISVNAAGTYTVTVTNPANGCTSSDVAVVTTNFNNPNVDAGEGNALTCVILEVSLNGSSSTTGAQFSWSGPGVASGANTANPTINALGTYFLTVTDPANGCTSVDSVIVEEGPCIIPYYKPCPNGKDQTKLGCELTSLYENYLLVGLDTIQQIFFATPDTVWIEIITVDGQTQNLFNILYQTPGYGLTDTIPNGLNPLILTGRFPIANLPNLLNLGVQDKIVYVRPVYPSINNSGVALTQGDVAQTSDLAREGFNVDGSGVKVCVLSDSYNTVPGNNANTDVVNGDLPGVGNPAGKLTPVQIFKDFPYGQRSDEGRAML